MAALASKLSKNATALLGATSNEDVLEVGI